MALAGVQQAKKAMEKKHRASPSNGKIFLKITNGEEVNIRPLEQDDDFTSAYVHQVEKISKNNRRYTIDVVCLDQDGKGRIPCPGCEARAQVADPKNDKSFARKYKFWLNVIWRNGPVYETEEVDGQDGQKFTRFKKDNSHNFVEVKDDDGNPVREDVLAIWSGGIRAAEELDHADTKYGGLTARDFTIERSGEGFDTKYKVSPRLDENGDMPRKDESQMTAADKKLAEGKADLSGFKQELSYDECLDEIRGGGASRADDDEGPAPKSASPFRRKREQS